MKATQKKKKKERYFLLSVASFGGTGRGAFCDTHSVPFLCRPTAFSPPPPQNREKRFRITFAQRDVLDDPNDRDLRSYLSMKRFRFEVCLVCLEWMPVVMNIFRPRNYCTNS